MTGLFERLRLAPDTPRPLSRQEQPDRKLMVIKRHLETVLNARQGCSQSSPELGLRDFNGHDVNRGELLLQVGADIRRMLQRFEPRIHVQALKAMPNSHDPLDLHFRLDCHVRVNHQLEAFQLELLVSGHDRYMHVR
ncbi:type VI secretion system baseplate subunit TssE [Enterobacterales bacterium AW_CKDN230030176-1A_HGKHYDSX7]